MTSLYGENFEKLIKLIEKVFERLAAANLHMKASKCSIGVKYLGFVVSDKVIHPVESKVYIVY